MAADLPKTDPYEALPLPVRLSLTRQEYLWLSDAEKASLEQDMTEPEWQ